jgi:hypothetical protein
MRHFSLRWSLDVYTQGVTPAEHEPKQPSYHSSSLAKVTVKGALVSGVELVGGVHRLALEVFGQADFG